MIQIWDTLSVYFIFSYLLFLRVPDFTHKNLFHLMRNIRYKYEEKI